MSPRQPVSQGDDAYHLLAEAIEQLVRERLALQDERIAHMNDDIRELKENLKDIREKDIPELQKALVQNQQAGLRRIIAVQASILTIILAAMVPLVLKILFHF